MKFFRCAFALSFVVSAACSHPENPQVQSDAGTDAEPDAHVDPITEDVFKLGCAGHTSTATTYTLPQSQVGQTVNLRLELPPHSIPVTGFTTEGVDTAAFSGMMDTFGNAVAVFKPTQARSYSATVIAMTAGGPLARIALTGEAIAPSGPLVFSSPFAEVGFDPFDMSLLVLTNTSTTTAVHLDPVLLTTVDDISDVGSFGCPSTLQPLGECLIGIGPLGMLGSHLGCRRDTIKITSDANTVSTDVFVSIKSDVSFAFAHGTISSNTNQSCTGSCTLRFVDGPVTLTATPDAGYRFAGWNGTTGCTTDPTCTLRNNTGYLNEVRPLFVPMAVPQISITFAGTGHGHVLAFSGLGEPVVCDRSCMVSPSSATEPVLLIAESASTFVRWDGACSGPSLQCNLGTATQDRSVTVTFDKDAMEVATLSPPDNARNVAFGAKYSAGFLANGDIVVSSGTTITRMTTAGVVVWTRRANATDLVVTPNGTIVYLNGWYSVIALDQGGAPLWRQEISVRPSATYFEGRRLAVTPSGDIATMFAGFLGTFSAANGAELWSTTENYGNAIAVNSAGQIAVGISNGITALVHRYTSDGTRILPDWPLVGGFSNYTELAYDSLGGLVAMTSGNSSTLRRFDATGAVVFQQAAPEHQILAVEGDNILTMGFSGPNNAQRTAVTVTSLAGVPRPEISKPYVSTLHVSFRMWPGGLATDGAGRVALLGTEALHGGTFGESINYQWVQLLQLP